MTVKNLTLSSKGCLFRLLAAGISEKNIEVNTINKYTDSEVTSKELNKWYPCMPEITAIRGYVLQAEMVLSEPKWPTLPELIPVSVGVEF